MISQLRWRILPFNCIFLSQISFSNTRLLSGVRWNRVRKCECVCCWLEGLRRYCSWTEGSQRSLMFYSKGSTSSSPGTQLLPWHPVPPHPDLGPSQNLQSTDNKHPLKQGVGSDAKRAVLGIKDKSKEKTSSLVIAVRDKHISDLGVAFRRKPCFPPFSLPCGFCMCFSLLLSQNHSCPMNY